MIHYLKKGYKWFVRVGQNIHFHQDVLYYKSETDYELSDNYLEKYNPDWAINCEEGRLYALTPTMFEAKSNKLALELKHNSKVNESQWQARDIVKVREIFNKQLELDVPDSIIQWQLETEPDLPWAEDHFNERVSGKDLNPSPSYEWWPYYQDDDKWKVEGKFSHTYPERMNTKHIPGIRYHYGNLADVVDLLNDNPSTRQAYLPIWFPEDTGAVHGERVPCSIGYQFYIRDGQIDIYYTMRSCDFRRHFKNDVYMAGRLLQWVAYNLDHKVKIGKLYMNIMNLHIFDGEEAML